MRFDFFAFLDTSFREELPHRPVHNWTEDPEHQIYDPWGKPGAGAPLLNKEGKVHASVGGRMQHEVQTVGG